MEQWESEDRWNRLREKLFFFEGNRYFVRKSGSVDIDDELEPYPPAYLVISDVNYPEKLIEEPELYVNVPALLSVKIPSKFIAEGISIRRLSGIGFWLFFFYASQRWIRYDTIPIKVLRQYNLPCHPREMVAYLSKNNQCERIDIKEQLYVNRCSTAFQSGSRLISPTYKNILLGPAPLKDENILDANKLCMLFEEIIDRFHFEQDIIFYFHAYRTVMYKALASGQRFVYCTESISMFSRKIRKLQLKRDTYSFMKYGTPVESTKCNFDYIDEALGETTRPFSEIINAHEERAHSITRREIVERLLKSNDDSNAPDVFAKLSQLTESPDQWYACGFARTALVFQDHMSSFSSTTDLFCVFDCYTETLISLEYGSESNLQMLLDGLSNAFIRRRSLPVVVSISKQPFTVTPAFRNMKEHTSKLGLCWHLFENEKSKDCKPFQDAIARFTRQLESLPFNIPSLRKTQKGGIYFTRKNVNVLYKVKPNIPPGELRGEVFETLVSNYNDAARQKHFDS